MTVNVYDHAFPSVVRLLRYDLVNRGDRVSVGEWQSTKVDHPLQDFIELRNCLIHCILPNNVEGLQSTVRPNLPWAEDHFQERVSGQPLNPPPSHEWWPHAQHGNEGFQKDERFSHTYPERFWPKYAGKRSLMTWEDREQLGATHYPNQGIRFDYGDLDDVVTQLNKNPLTRQAYLPVFFPEDTGAVHGERVPCTLGYHWLVRPINSGRLLLHQTYYIRSCDFVRHFADDVYMAWRLTQWICNQLDDKIYVGDFTMHVGSMHCFAGDLPKLEREMG